MSVRMSDDQNNGNKNVINNNGRNKRDNYDNEKIVVPVMIATIIMIVIMIGMLLINRTAEMRMVIMTFC